MVVVVGVRRRPRWIAQLLLQRRINNGPGLERAQQQRQDNRAPHERFFLQACGKYRRRNERCQQEFIFTPFAQDSVISDSPFRLRLENPADSHSPREAHSWVYFRTAPQTSFSLHKHHERAKGISPVAQDCALSAPADLRSPRRCSPANSSADRSTTRQVLAGSPTLSPTRAARSTPAATATRRLVRSPRKRVPRLSCFWRLRFLVKVWGA